MMTELNQINKANKAAVGTFISKIDWSKSESLKKLFLPFMYLGEEKE